MRTLQLQLDEVNSRITRLERSEAGNPSDPIIREVPPSVPLSFVTKSPQPAMSLAG